MDSDRGLHPPQFTPVYDFMVEEFGAITTLVYGAVWRYAQQDDGYSWASQTKIAERVGLTDRTVRRHLRTLVRAGVLIDRGKHRAGGTKSYSLNPEYGKNKGNADRKSGGTGQRVRGGADRKSYKETTKETTIRIDDDKGFISKNSEAEKTLLGIGINPKTVQELLANHSEEAILAKAEHWKEPAMLVSAIREDWKPKASPEETARANYKAGQFADFWDA